MRGNWRSDKKGNRKAKPKEYKDNVRQKNGVKHKKRKVLTNKEKRKKKKCKLERNQKNLDVTSHPNLYPNDCDFYGLTKAQSISRTQLNRANRVKKKVGQLRGYSARHNCFDK